ncbi:hypothetical protein ACFSFW_24220 [Fredinandcohnia salidurans]|uniref:Uncharacterized protein n=3 Tax=Bacillati TaxID=1783272 RepID=A0ABW4MVG7_9BACI
MTMARRLRLTAEVAQVIDPDERDGYMVPGEILEALEDEQRLAVLWLEPDDLRAQVLRTPLVGSVAGLFGLEIETEVVAIDPEIDVGEGAIVRADLEEAYVREERLRGETIEQEVGLWEVVDVVETIRAAPQEDVDDSIERLGLEVDPVDVDEDDQEASDDEIEGPAEADPVDVDDDPEKREPSILDRLREFVSSESGVDGLEDDPVDDEPADLFEDLEEDVDADGQEETDGESFEPIEIEDDVDDVLALEPVDDDLEEDDVVALEPVDERP